MTLIRAISGAVLLALPAFPGYALAQPAKGDMTLGDPGAPVEVIEYASMTCPHCAAFHLNSFPLLKAEFIDTGQVYFVFREFPLDQMAVMGSVLARCAGPERYFPFIDALFRQQEVWSRPAEESPLQGLMQLAQLGGVSQAELEACLQNQELVDSVINSRLQAEQQFAVASTPAFVVNGVLVQGNLPWDEFAGLLRLAAAGEDIGDGDKDTKARTEVASGNSGTYIAIAIVLGLLAIIALFFLRRPRRQDEI